MNTASVSRATVVYDGVVEPADLREWERELSGVIARMAPLFYRRESKLHAEQYLRGLLSPLARKNGWTIAEYSGEPEPKALQRLLNLSPWNTDALRTLNRDYAMDNLADPAAITPIQPGSRRKGQNRSACSGNTRERWVASTTVRSPLSSRMSPRAVTGS